MINAFSKISLKSHKMLNQITCFKLMSQNVTVLSNSDVCVKYQIMQLLYDVVAFNE